MNRFCSVTYSTRIFNLKKCCHFSSSNQESCSLLKNYGDFYQMINDGKARARRSIVIEDRITNSPYRSMFLWYQDRQALNEVLFGSKTAVIPTIYRWRNGSDGTLSGGNRCRKFFLIEFSNQADFDKGVEFFQNENKVKMSTQNMCILDSRNTGFFMKNLSPINKIKVHVRPHQLGNENISLNSVFTADGRSLCQYEDYLIVSSRKSRLSQTDETTVIRLLEKLLNGSELISDLQYKIRFFICHQIEEQLRFSLKMKKSSNSTLPIYQNRYPDLMEHYRLIPFGSDVSGFGNADSDIDFCFVHNDRASNLDFKKKVRTSRSIRMLDSISNVLESSIRQNHSQSYLKNFINIQRIFQAFVPIIKCRSCLLPSINIDLSIDTEWNSGTDIASYLYHCAFKADQKVRPFINLLKLWGKHHEIIHSNPGNWFSSFQMTMLGLAFLQHRNLIPTIKDWKESERITSAYYNNNSQKNGNLVSSATDVQLLTATELYKDIDELFKEFLRFMISYDFWRNAIDLNTGQNDLKKPVNLKANHLSFNDESPCYVINPILPKLNICKKVSESELERFLSFCNQSLELMSKQNYSLIDLFKTKFIDRFESISLKR